MAEVLFAEYAGKLDDPQDEDVGCICTEWSCFCDPGNPGSCNCDEGCDCACRPEGGGDA